MEPGRDGDRRAPDVGENSDVERLRQSGDTPCSAQTATVRDVRLEDVDGRFGHVRAEGVEASEVLAAGDRQAQRSPYLGVATEVATLDRLFEPGHAKLFQALAEADRGA